MLRPRTATSRRLRGSAPITAGAAADPGGRPSPRLRPIAFGAHQLLEYLLAGALAELSIHVGRSGLLLGAAGAFFLLAVTARGPLGLARICSPRLHASLDVIVALAVAAAPIIPALRPDASGIVVVEVSALAWVRLSTLTRYARSASTATPPLATPPMATSPGQPSPAAAAAPTGPTVARGLGFLAGRSARKLEANEKLRVGARRAGRRAGAIQRAWRKPPP